MSTTLAQSTKPRKLVIVKLAAIGDVAMTCQVLLRYKQSLTIAETQIYWVIDKGLIALAQSILGNSLKVNWVGIEAKGLLTGTLWDKTLKFLEIGLKLLSIKPNELAIMHRDSRYNLLKLFTLNPFCKTAQINASGQEVLRLSSTLKALGYVEELVTHTKPTQKGGNENLTVGLLLGGGKNLKVTFVEKTWPHYEKLSKLLLQDDRVNLILFGTEEASSLATKIVNINSKQKILNRVGQLELPKLAEELSKLRVLVTVDTGASHIAATVMKKTSQGIFVLFGPTNFDIWAPKSLHGAHIKVLNHSIPCAPCYKDDGNYTPCTLQENARYSCMTNISPEYVSNEVLSFMFG